MPSALANLKDAERELLVLRNALPNLDLSLDHCLRVFFPRLPADTCTDFLFINEEIAAQPGQNPTISSQSVTALIDQCYLTGQIPTFVQGATRVYNYAYTLDEQDRTAGVSAPELEKYLEFVVRSPQLCVRDALNDFWRTPHKDLNGQAPKDWLSQFSHRLIRAEASVRHEDNTFSPTALDMINQVLPDASPSPASKTPGPYGFYTLALSSRLMQRAAVLHGAFVITTKHLPLISANVQDKRTALDPTPRPSVLYLPSTGLEVFDSLAALSQELTTRLNDPYQRETLLTCVLTEDRERALAHEQIDYSPVADSAIATVFSDQLINKQKSDMHHAWSVARNLKQDTSLDQLSDCVDQSLAASLPLNPANILRGRYTRLLESQLPDWLKTASDSQKTQWRLAVERLNHERLAAESDDAQPLSEIGRKHTLLGYARLQLQQQIKKDHGIDVDPDEIFISTTEALRTGPLINPVSGSGFPAGMSLGRTGPIISYHTTRRSLSELALSNVGIWDVTFALTAQVKDGAGQKHAVLTSSYLKTLVRQLDIGERYKKNLKELLVNSSQAQWRKERYVAFKQAQLNLDLLEATLAGALTTQQVSWVRAALEQPVENNRAQINGEQVKVHLLMLRYKPLPGLLVFSATGSGQLLCYTPGGPESRWFLVANSRNELGQILSRPIWRAYVMRHVTPAQQPYIKPLLERGLSEANLQLQGISHDLFEASYDTEALHAIRDADEQSTSTWESNVNTAKEAVLTAIDILSFALPTRVLLPIVLARFIAQIIRGLDALQRDEKHEALLHFMESITYLTDGASDFTGSAVFGNSIRQRAKQPVPSLSPAAASHYPGARLRLRTGDEYGAGVYEAPTANGQTACYTKNTNGRFYRSQYDNLDNTWRALDERKPNAPYSIPLRELSAGQWDVDPTTPLLKQKPGIERVIDNARVRGVDLSRYTPDEQGIYRIDNMRYIKQDSDVFEVYSGWLGRNWYLQPQSSSSAGASASFKVRRTAGRWQIKHRLADNSKRWVPLTGHLTELTGDVPHLKYSDYDMPAEYQEALRDITENHRSVLDGITDFMDFASERSLAHRAFKELRIKLLADAKAYFLTKPAKPRATRPQLPGNVQEQALINHLFEQSDGIVWGETHSHQSSKKILIDNMAEFARHDVKVLYMEHLQSDLHQSLLDDYFQSGKMPLRLNKYLEDQDFGHQINPSSRHTFSQLVREARRHGIRVIAVDCSASYYPKSTPSETPWLNRYEMFSYFASRTIRAHQAQNPGGKWIALTGNSHANTFEGIPGLAELEGAISVRVSDSAPGTSRGLRQDIGEIIPADNKHANYRFLKNDYWLQIDIPGTKPHLPALSPSQTNNRLPAPGFFRLDSASPQGAQLIHRSNNHEIVHTPLRTDANGQIFIERESWPTIHQKRYDTLKDLIHGLQDINMTQVQ